MTQMSDNAHELHLFASNDGKLYERAVKPAYKTLALLKKNGTYKHADAVRLFTSICTDAAAMYQREVARQPFSSADKRSAAAHFVDYFEVEYMLGNMPH